MLDIFLFNNQYNKEEIISAIERACFDESYRENVKNLLNPYGINNSVENFCKAIESYK